MSKTSASSPRKLIYTGSVKNLWEAGTDCLEFEYSDAYSVFDWGRMPDALAHKGESLAALGAYFFKEVGSAGAWREAGLGDSKWVHALHGKMQQLVRAELAELERQGMGHHYIERPAANRLLVHRVGVTRPQEHKLAGQTLYHYKTQHNAPHPRLIPLEVVFRFGMPQGSSLVERLTPEYASQLGLDTVPAAGELFEIPIIEFFTKLEETDRFLTWEQALNYSGLEAAQFEKLLARSLCLAMWLSKNFGSKGLELWDGKFEWALGTKGELWLVDSVGPDELRLLDPKSGTQISKEFLRLFYRKTKWFEAVKQAKKELVGNPELDWKKSVIEKVGEPPRLSDPFRLAADALYPSLAMAICGENPGGAGIPLDQMLERIRQCQSQ